MVRNVRRKAGNRYRPGGGARFALMAAVACSCLSAYGQSTSPFWLTVEPAELGFRADLRTQLDALLPSESPRVTSVGILRDQKLAYAYFRNADSNVGYQQPTGPGVPQNVASVTKSVLGLLVGIALDKGVITSIDDPVSKYLAEAADESLDPRARTVTIKHLLTMSGGWESRDSDPPPFHFSDALKRPFAFQPGEKFQYDNATSHLLGIALARAAGMSLERFAVTHLFGPLGIANYGWRLDPQGNTMGWHNLRLTLDDMLKIGQLVLNDGEWNGRLIVSKAYLADMLKAHNAGGPPSNTPYGYQWYVFRTPDRQHRAYGAFGYGGQLIYVVPALKVIIAKTQTRDQRGGDVRFIREVIMPGLTP
jgi:CubicO group peptidase (beta-lactamase class C family)